VTRALAWDGCWNVRDLGGIPLEQGGETRRGVLVRADNVRRLTDAGWRSLADHGVTRVVDLRLQTEVAADPPREVDVDVVHVSLVGDVDPAFHEQVTPYVEADDELGYYRWVYAWILDERAASFAEALAAIADADGPVVFHCAGGKDRTGLVAAFLLRLAGVSIDEVVRDYALSSEMLAAEPRAWPDEEDRAHREFLERSPAGVMRWALEHVDRKYGGVESYLRAAGLSAERIAQLRDRLAAP
jgi:protein-tyrosine phosphatase